MARRQPVGPRVPKDEFMRALGLNPQNPHHEGHYRVMRDEAITVYNRLNSTKDNLMAEKRSDPHVAPPYFWHHIRPDRRREAIVEVWQQARPGTPQRTLFDLGATDGEHSPNWVTLWLLYSVFRSRDVRNNRNRRTIENGNTIPGMATGSATGGVVKALYDPARNRFVTR